MTLIFKKFHEHDSDNSNYLGSEISDDLSVDYYFSNQSGNMPTVIARFGIDGDYYSSLLIVKTLVNNIIRADEKKTTMDALNEMLLDTQDVALLARATILSIEAGLLKENFNEPLEKKVILKR